MTPIDIFKLFGSKGAFLQDGTYSYTAATPASNNFTLTNTGLAQNITISDYNWLLQGSASNYEVFATLVSGTLQTNAGTGTWLNLGTTRGWGLHNSTATNRSCQLTFQIRPVGGSVVASCTVNLDLTTT